MAKNPHNKKVTPELVEQFLKYRAKGLSYKRIGVLFGLNETTIYNWCNPGFVRERDLRRRERQKFNKTGESELPTVIEKDWHKRRLDVPKGPTNWNQALLGDPLSGRSALDRRQQA